MSRSRRTLLGLGLVVGGVLCGLLALTALPWFRNSLGGVYLFGTKVSELRTTISGLQSSDRYGVLSFGVSPLYFRWLAVAVLIVAALAAAATVGFDDKASRLTSGVAAVISLAGLVLTALSIRVFSVDAAKLERVTGRASNPPDYLDYLKATGIGAWAMVLGYLAVGVGALLAAGGRQALREALADEPDDEPDETNRPDEVSERTDIERTDTERTDTERTDTEPGTAADPVVDVPPEPVEPERRRRENW